MENSYERNSLNCYLAAPRPTLDRLKRTAHTMLITAFELFRFEGHREPRNEVGSLKLG